MPRKPAPRIVSAVTDRLWKRDRLQMQAVEALLSAVEQKRRRPKRPPRPTRAKRTR